MIASPMNLSIVAPYSSAIDDISRRYWLRRLVSSSDSSRSVVSVKPAMSEKKIVSFLRCDATSTLFSPLKIDL